MTMAQKVLSSSKLSTIINVGPFAIFMALILSLAFTPKSFADPKERPLSVLYFANTTNNPDAAWLSKGLADMLVSDLAASGAFSIIERAELEKILREQELALSGLVDEQSAPQIGKLLGAKVLVVGSYIFKGTDLRFDAKALDVETGTVVCAASVLGTVDQALDMERDLANRLASGLGAPPIHTSPATASLKAVETYYRGIDLLDAGRYTEAVELFGLSSREDPGFLKPGKGLEDAYRYLKDFRKQRYQREINGLIADISDLTKRISAPVFYSFGDMVRDPQKFGFKDAQEASAFYRSRPNVLNGSTPVEATWFLQYLYRDLAGKTVEYFGDRETAVYCRQKILSLADAAQKAYPTDPFLPELIYQKLLVYRETQDWLKVRDTCEQIMSNYGDYRMITSVEDFYAEALGKLESSQ